MSEYLGTVKSLGFAFIAALLIALLYLSGCASINDANRAAAQEDAVIRALDKEAGE